MRDATAGATFLVLLALGAALDAQQLEGRFTLGFDGPDVLRGGPGRPVEGLYFCTLTDTGPEPGSQGWSVSLVSENAFIAEIGVGAAAAGGPEPVTDAARFFDGGFKVSELSCPPIVENPECIGHCSAISAVVLSFARPITLPALSTSTIAFLRIATDPESTAREARLRYLDGCRISGGPVRNDVTVLGNSAPARLGEKIIELGPSDACVLFEEHVLAFSDRAMDSDTAFDRVRGVVHPELDVCGDDCDIVAPTPRGEPGTANVFANVVSESRRRVSGWTIVLEVVGDAILLEAGTRGTVADAEPRGLRSARTGFEQTIVSDSHVVSSVVLSLDDARALPLVGTRSILRVDLQTPPLEADGERTVTVRFRDRLADSQAITVLEAGSFTVFPCNADLASVDIRFETARQPPFRRGDANGDGVSTLPDAVWTLERFFRAGPEFPCEAAADTNADGVVRPIEDALWLLNHLLRAGPPPPGRFPDCDVETHGLSCVAPLCR